MHLSALAPWTRNFPLPLSLNDSLLRPSDEPASPDRDPGSAGIQHDLGNLMTALRLCADLMAEPGILAPTYAHLAEQLSALVLATERLTRESSARLGDASFPMPALPERRVANLGQAVRDLAPLLSAMAGRHVDVQIACMPCPGEIHLTEASLSRVLMNLVRNAADAMPSGGKIRITAQRGGARLSARSADQDSAMVDRLPSPSKRRTVLLTVADNGPGILPATLQRIFEPGFSTHRSDASAPDSSHHGLGLSVVQQLLAQAGGTISAQNGAAGGARFLIELPLTNVTPCLPSERFSRGVSEPV
ncbi:MAG TPA: ATP-binding protein [Acidobacteriaceae bacterium]|nr:ATP-binding protein [Acidobacteriaceae bacterium]